MTTKAFVIGHPINHSRSPLIHGTWLTQYNIDGSYEAIDVEPAALTRFSQRIRTGEFAGGNVTIPHKETAFTLCDDVDPLALEIGAVNTLVYRDGGIFGTNTDYLGFLGNLDQNASGWDKNLDEGIVFGAGGAARAVLVALARRGIGQVHILNRTRAKAESLADEFGAGFKAHGLEDFAALAPLAGLVVNTTSLGMHGTSFKDLALHNLAHDALVTDIVYTPLITPLLAEALRLGRPIVDGLGMLLHQAVPGFAAWFGTEPEVTPQLRRAVEATLGHQ